MSWPYQTQTGQPSKQVKYPSRRSCVNDTAGPPASRRLLVVQPDPKGVLDNFERWLTAEGLTIQTVRAYNGEQVPRKLGDAAAVLVLGGSMSSLDDRGYPWLEDIRELLRSAHDAGQPALGICLGAQLMAQAHGGLVEAGAHGTEGGLISVHWCDDVKDDALLSDLPDPFLVGALHGDGIVKLPPTAKWLAKSDQYLHQAFRLGSSSWGLQFHPEVSVEAMRMWVSCMDRNEGHDISGLENSASEFEQQQDTVLVGTSIVANRFADLIK